MLTSLVAIAPAVYGFSEVAMANLRQTNDPWNTVVGGFLGGFVGGLYRTCLPLQHGSQNMGL